MLVTIGTSRLNLAGITKFKDERKNNMDHGDMVVK